MLTDHVIITSTMASTTFKGLVTNGVPNNKARVLRAMARLDRDVMAQGVTPEYMRRNCGDEICSIMKAAKSENHRKLVEMEYLLKKENGTYTVTEEGYKANEILDGIDFPPYVPKPKVPKAPMESEAPKGAKASSSKPKPKADDVAKPEEIAKPSDEAKAVDEAKPDNEYVAEGDKKAEDYSTTDVDNSSDSSDSDSADDVDTDEDAAKKMSEAALWALDDIVMTPADVPPPDVPGPSRHIVVKIKTRPSGDIDKRSAKKPRVTDDGVEDAVKDAIKDAVKDSVVDAVKELAVDDAVERAKRVYEKAVQDAKAAYDKAVQDAKEAVEATKAAEKDRLSEELDALIADKERKEAEMKALIEEKEAELKAIADKVAEKEAQLLA